MACARGYHLGGGDKVDGPLERLSRRHVRPKRMLGLSLGLLAERRRRRELRGGPLPLHGVPRKEGPDGRGVGAHLDEDLGVLDGPDREVPHASQVTVQGGDQPLLVGPFRLLAAVAAAVPAPQRVAVRRVLRLAGGVAPGAAAGAADAAAGAAAAADAAAAAAPADAGAVAAEGGRRVVIVVLVPGVASAALSAGGFFLGLRFLGEAAEVHPRRGRALGERERGRVRLASLRAKPPVALVHALGVIRAEPIHTHFLLGGTQKQEGKHTHGDDADDGDVVESERSDAMRSGRGETKPGGPIEGKRCGEGFFSPITGGACEVPTGIVLPQACGCHETCMRETPNWNVLTPKAHVPPSLFRVHKRLTDHKPLTPSTPSPTPTPVCHRRSPPTPCPFSVVPSPHQQALHEVEAVDGPHPDLDAAPLAVGDEVGAHVVLSGAQDVYLEGLEVAREGQRPAVHYASRAELGKLGDGLPERVDLFTAGRGRETGSEREGGEGGLGKNMSGVFGARGRRWWRKTREKISGVYGKERGPTKKTRRRSIAARGAKMSVLQARACSTNGQNKMLPLTPLDFYRTHLQEVKLAEGRDHEAVSRPAPAVHRLHHRVEHGPDDLRVLHVNIQVDAGLRQSLLLKHLLERRHVVLEPLACLREGKVLDPLAWLSGFDGNVRGDCLFGVRRAWGRWIVWAGHTRGRGGER